MEILFESISETEEEFEFNGQIIINKGNVQIVKFESSLPDPIGLNNNGN